MTKSFGAADFKSLSVKGKLVSTLNRVTLGDANSTIAGTPSIAAITGALTAARSYTLPAASTYAAGATILFIDEVGGVAPANYAAITSAGSDTINGLNGFTYPAIIANPYGFVELESNGVSNWTVTRSSSIALEFNSSTISPVPNNNLRSARAIGIGASGGAGSGRRGAAGTARGGGGGGAPGGLSDFEYSTADLLALGPTLSIAIGAAGTSGAAITVDSTNGINGTAGGVTTFSIGGTTILRADGGGGGQGGTTTGGAAGAAPQVTTIPVGTAGAGNTVGGANGGAAFYAGGGGGGGGGLDASNTARGGGTGAAGSRAMNGSTNGGSPGSTTPTDGGNGTLVAPGIAGAGAGGGGTKPASNAGNGGSAPRGGAPGGGGASENGFNSGAGGAASNGYGKLLFR